MYLLIKAIGVSNLQESRWEELNIGDIPVYKLFLDYRKMYITLGNTFLDEPVNIELESLRAQYSSHTETFNELLVIIGNQALQTLDSIPELKPKYATYSDGFRAGYKIEPVNLYTSDTADLPKSEKSSLRIWRDKPDTDMVLFYKHCMVSINGFFHNTDCNGEYAYVVEGAKSMMKAKSNQIGFLSFLNVGEIENVAVKEEMIFKQSDDSKLRNRIYIKLNKDLTNKSVLLVLGGYLLFADAKYFWQTGDDEFAIDISRMPFLERFFEAQPYIDYTALGLPINSTNPSTVNVDELLSDEVLTKYLTLPQTFFVIIDTPTIFINHIHIKSSALPGMFIGYKEPKYPLIVSNGRVAEYWKTFEDGYWAINVVDSYLHNRVFSTVSQIELVNVGDSDIPARPYYNSGGFLLEIGKDF